MISADAFELGTVGGDGPALLCLHGLTGTPYEVRPPSAIFEQHGFACLGPLLPGHGCTVEELARTPRDAWVRCALDTHDRLAATHSRVYVLGLSLGGVLALRVAEERAVAGALVIAAPLDLGRFRRLAVPVLSLALASIAKTPAIFDPESRERHPGYRRMPLRAVLELIRLQSEVEAQLPRIVAPLRLLYSRRDPTVRVDDARRILRGANRAQGIVDYLESSAHVVTVDRERERVEQWIVNSILELEKTHELTERTSRL
jgi:carboxylesterase